MRASITALRKSDVGEKENFYKISWVVLTIVYLLRIFYLDADIPNWGILTYQPIDEGFYGNLALNMQNFGSINPNDYFGDRYTFLMQPNEMTPLFVNVPIYLFMTLIGDNYYGFRMASVAEGLFIIFLASKLTVSLFQDMGKNRETQERMSLITGLVLICSFPLFGASRIVEPSLCRALIVGLTILLYSGIEKPETMEMRSFLIGFIVISSILLVYATNIFLGMLVVAFCVRILKKKGIEFFAKHLLFGLFGAIAAYLIAAIYFKNIWNISPLTSFFLNITAFSSSQNQGYGGAYGLLGSPVQLMKNIRDFLSSNLILYSLPLLPAFVMGINVRTTRDFERTGGTGTIIFAAKACVASLLVQTILSSDFIARKEIVLVIPIALLCALGVYRITTEMANKKTMGEAIGLVAALFLCAYVYDYRMFRVDTTITTYKWFDYPNRIAIMLLCIASIGLTLCLIIGGRYISSNDISSGTFDVGKKALPFALTVFLAINCYLVFHNYYQTPTFTEKQAMEELGEIAGDDIVAGDYVSGFTLYNDIKPLNNDRSVEVEYLNMDNVYYFDYAEAQNFSSYPRDLWQSIRTVKVFDRAYVSNMGDSAVALYQRNLTAQDVKARDDARE